MARDWRVASMVAMVAAIALLWLFPLALFPHPSTNEAIALSDLAAFVGIWILLRGSRDRLPAPYGFDELVLILVVGAAIVVLSRPSTVNG